MGDYHDVPVAAGDRIHELLWSRNFTRQLFAALLQGAVAGLKL